MDMINADFRGRQVRRRVWRWVILIAVLLLIFWAAPALLGLYTDWLWFLEDVRYPSVFSTILSTKIGLGLVFGLLFVFLLMVNVEIARRLARRSGWYSEETALRRQIAEVMEYFSLSLSIYRARDLRVAYRLWGGRGRLRTMGQLSPIPPRASLRPSGPRVLAGRRLLRLPSSLLAIPLAMGLHRPDRRVRRDRRRALPGQGDPYAAGRAVTRLAREDSPLAAARAHPRRQGLRLPSRLLCSSLQ